jgi:nitrogen PTS system EIIA component
MDNSVELARTLAQGLVAENRAILVSRGDTRESREPRQQEGRGEGKHEGVGAHDRGSALLLCARILARDAFVAEGPVTSESLYDALLEREALQSTAPGDGIALPHAAVPELREVRSALVVVPGGIGDFAPFDQKPVSIVLATVYGPSTRALHLRTLVRLADWLARASLRQRLLDATDSNALCHLLSVEVLKMGRDHHSSAQLPAVTTT